MKVSKTYGEKLKNPLWQKKRLKIMERDAFTCQACGCKEITLNIHHFKYVGNPWDCPDEFLITLCEECHEAISAVNFEIAPEKIFIRKIDRGDHFVFLMITNIGVSFFMKWPGQKIIYNSGVTHQILRSAVQDIINYWLQTDRCHYLTDKSLTNPITDKN